MSSALDNMLNPESNLLFNPDGSVKYPELEAMMTCDDMFISRGSIEAKFRDRILESTTNSSDARANLKLTKPASYCEITTTAGQPHGSDLSAFEPANINERATTSTVRRMVQEVYSTDERRVPTPVVNTEVARLRAILDEIHNWALLSTQGYRATELMSNISHVLEISAPDYGKPKVQMVSNMEATETGRFSCREHLQPQVPKSHTEASYLVSREAINALAYILDIRVDYLTTTGALDHLAKKLRDVWNNRNLGIPGPSWEEYVRVSISQSHTEAKITGPYHRYSPEEAATLLREILERLPE